MGFSSGIVVFSLCLSRKAPTSCKHSVVVLPPLPDGSMIFASNSSSCGVYMLASCTHFLPQIINMPVRFWCGFKWTLGVSLCEELGTCPGVPTSLNLKRRLFSVFLYLQNGCLHLKWSFRCFKVAFYGNVVDKQYLTCCRWLSDLLILSRLRS